MGTKANLEQYAQSYLEQIVKEYGVKKMYIKTSGPYQKHHNLVEDKSSWNGWEISASTNL